jgi:hypothetical protein
VNDTDWEAGGKNIVSWCFALCSGVIGGTEKKARFSYPAIKKVFTWQNITKMTGARSPLPVKNLQNDAWRCHYDGSVCGLCVIQILCLRVSRCYGALLLVTLLFFYVIYDIKKREIE